MFLTGKAQSSIPAAALSAELPEVDYESLYREAIVANRAREEQLALLAHELRNPLNALSTSSEVLKRSGPGSAQAISAANVIARQVRKLADLIELRLPRAVLPRVLGTGAAIDADADVDAAGDAKANAPLGTAVKPVELRGVADLLEAVASRR